MSCFLPKRTTQEMMKLILFACLVALAAGQTESDCSIYGFHFFNGYNATAYFQEVKWDWFGSNFNDGTNDAFDSAFYAEYIIDGVSYLADDFYSTPTNFTCDLGTTDIASSSTATYIFNLTANVVLRREFYAPRASSWIRIIDSIINNEPAAITLAVNYTSDYGSDEDTVFRVQNDYYWVSDDGSKGTGDPVIGVTASRQGAQVIPVRAGGELLNGYEKPNFKYNDINVPAGETRSVMFFIGQYRSPEEAIDDVIKINSMPNEIFVNTSAAASTIVNWPVCQVQIEVVDPKSAYCSTPALVTFNVVEDADITINGNAVTVSNQQFTASVNNGQNQVQHLRKIDGCTPVTVNFDFKIPSANLSIAIDDKATLPSVTAAGGYGEYKYCWSFSSSNLNEAFGNEATVTVTDKEGCSLSATVDVPELLVAAPQAGKVSGAAQLFPFFAFGVIAMAF